MLAKGGQPTDSDITALYEARGGMQHYAWAYLAQAMWLRNPGDSRLDTLQSGLVNNAIFSATGAHWEEDAREGINWNSDTRSTAIILHTFARIWPETNLLPSVVRWLMIAREADHWETTQETAWSVMALAEYMIASGELSPDFAWNAEFNGEEVASGRANAGTLGEASVTTIPREDIADYAVNRLLIAREGGDGQLYYTAHLRAYLPIELVEPASRGIIVSRRYLDADGNPITEARAGDVITVEVTITAPGALNYLVVEDPIPAGAEGIDTGLATESILSDEAGITSEAEDAPLSRGWRWYWYSNVDFLDEKVVLYADFLSAGTYQFTYQLRLSLPGTYRVIPTTAMEFYMPEVYGRGQGALFTILPAAD